MSPYVSNNLAFHVGDDRQAVTENRSRLQGICGPTVFMNQSHGERVVVIDGLSLHEPNADALITQEAGISLAVLVADCIPLLLWDERVECIAAVHVGRRGLTNGIAIKVIEVMTALGADGIQALLGPSICGRCYEVGLDIYDEVSRVHPSAQSTSAAGRLSLDLPAALSEELASMGIPVTRSRICTAESPHHFSYRRDGITGRQAGVISI